MGVDGGATKTLALLADGDGTILTRREAAGSNQLVSGTEAAAQLLLQLVEESCAAAGCAPPDLQSVIFGLAGTGTDDDRQRLHDAIHLMLVRNGFGSMKFLIETDARVALEGAFDGGPGIIAIAGTGSVALGKNASGELVRAGGWGRLIGDEGGGYWIGRAALKAVSRDLDGVRSSGILLELFTSRKKLDSRAGIIQALYRDHMDLSSLAPLVLEGCERGDGVCTEILEKAAEELAAQVQVVLHRMDGGEEFGVALHGGLVGNGSVYAEMLAAAIRRSSSRLRVQPPRFGPAEGALIMARKETRKG